MSIGHPSSTYMRPQNTEDSSCTGSAIAQERKAGGWDRGWAQPGIVSLCLFPMHVLQSLQLQQLPTVPVSSPRPTAMNITPEASLRDSIS